MPKEEGPSPEAQTIIDTHRTEQAGISALLELERRHSRLTLAAGFLTNMVSPQMSTVFPDDGGPAARSTLAIRSALWLADRLLDTIEEQENA